MSKGKLMVISAIIMVIAFMFCFLPLKLDINEKENKEIYFDVKGTEIVLSESQKSELVNILNNTKRKRFSSSESPTYRNETTYISIRFTPPN